MSPALRLFHSPLVIGSMLLMLVRECLRKGFMPSGRAMTAPSHSSPGKLSYTFLSLGALAAIATYPSPPVLSIQRLVAADGTLYAGACASWTPCDTPDPSISISVSPDAGQTWEEVPAGNAPPDVLELLKQPAALPVTTCLPADPAICYRVDGRAIIEESRDGGNTWQIAWQVPPERVRYMQRESFGLFASPKKPELRTYDIALVPLDGQTVPVVAMGSDGVVSLIGGAWQRLPVHISGYPDAKPTPWKANRLGEAVGKIVPELLAAFLVALAAYLGLSLYGWRLAEQHFQNDQKPTPSSGKVLRFLGLWALVSGALLLTGQMIGIGTLDFLLFLAGGVGLGVLPLVMIIVIGVHWSRKAAASARRETVGETGAFAFWCSAGVFALPALVFIFWALGVIPGYPLALVLSTAVGLGMVGVGIYAVRKNLLA